MLVKLNLTASGCDKIKRRLVINDASPVLSLPHLLTAHIREIPTGDALPSVTRLTGLNVWNSKPIFLLFFWLDELARLSGVRFQRDVDFLLVYFDNAFSRFEKHTTSPTPLFSERKVITWLTVITAFLTNSCWTYWKCWCLWL